MTAKTYIPKREALEKKYYLIDAKNQVLGRLATKVAGILMGKGKPYYTPHVDCGDHVVIIHAKDIRVTGKKLQDKWYDHYTGYPGGRYEYNLETLLERKPTQVIETAVRKMLPKSRLGRKMLGHLHVYADGSHRQQAQQPIPITQG